MEPYPPPLFVPCSTGFSAESKLLPKVLITLAYTGSSNRLLWVSHTQDPHITTFALEVVFCSRSGGMAVELYIVSIVVSVVRIAS